MKRIITFLLVVALAVCFAAPAFAWSDADGMASGLNSGWSASSYPSLGSVSGGSWFSAALQQLNNIQYYLKNIDTNLSSVKTSVTSISTNTGTISTNIGKIQSSIGTLVTDSAAIKKSLGNIETSLSNISQLATSTDSIDKALDSLMSSSYWSSTGASSSSVRGSFFDYCLSNLSTISTRVNSVNGHLENLEATSDQILSAANSININLASSLLVGTENTPYGLLDAMTSLGANDQSSIYSYLSSLAYCDDSGAYHSYLADLKSGTTELNGRISLLDSNVHSAFDQVYIRQGNILTQLGNILLSSVRIRQLIDGDGNNGSGLLPESIGIHSDTTAIHSDTSDILNEVYGIHSDTSSIDYTTQRIDQYFVSEEYVVDDFDNRNILTEFPLRNLYDSARSVLFAFGLSGGNTYSRLTFLSAIPLNTFQFATFNATDAKKVFPAGTYRFSNCYITIYKAGTIASWIRVGADVGASVIVKIPYDFTIGTIQCRVTQAENMPLNTNIPIGIYGPLEVEGTNGLLNIIANKLSLLQFSLADSDAVNAKLKNQGVIDSATSDFFSGSDSKTSLGTGGLNGIKSVGNVAGTAFESGASAGDLGSALDGAMSSEGGLGWFSQATADDLDTVPMTFGLNDPVIVTDYVGQYQSAVADWFAGRGDP